jgi:putative FmdB family regulatory protein
MPISKFKCGDCGKEFAKIHTGAADETIKCPVCRSENTSELGAAFEPSGARLPGFSCDDSCDTCADTG